MSESTRYRESPDAWQTKVSQALLLPFPLPWLLIASIVFGASCGIVALFEPNSETITFLAIEAILIAAIANAVVFYERLLDEIADVFPKLVTGSEDASKQLIEKCYRNTFWSRNNIWSGIGLAALLVIADLLSPFKLFSSTPGIICAHFLCFAIGFLGGSMLWTMLGIARLMLSLGRDVELKLSIFDSSTSPLRTASSIMLKVSLTAVLIYLLGTSIYIVIPTEPQLTNIVLAGAFGCFLLLYFIIPQFNIHKALVHIKEDRLSKLVAKIDGAFDEVTGDPTSDNIGKLKELFELQHVVNGKRAWSFGVNELIMLIGSIVLPLFLFVAGYYLTR